ncbi:MAG: ABC transporter ATP-binding protein [Clostridia bacterium]|nr:ABC transporter ATP-binding protein [Clostridia bacterium]MDE6677001.1 ABC transporter ATP-binding protein [Clostridia bacterium]
MPVFDFQESNIQNCILECKDLSKNYGGFIALSNVNLKIPAGGIVGLLGPNGSGKTTLIKLAMGMLQPTNGEILIDGQKTGAATKAITAYLPDANYLCKWMRVEQQVNYYADFFPDFRREKAEEMLARLGIGMKQKIKALSKGNKEKLGLILTMSRDAKLYILDEPIAGVDPAARDFILDTIMKNKPEGATIFLCTHLIADIEPVLTHAIFLRNGQIVLNAPANEVRVKAQKSLDELFREVFRW